MCFSGTYIFIASHLLQRKYKKVVNPYCIKIFVEHEQKNVKKPTTFLLVLLPAWRIWQNSNPGHRNVSDSSSSSANNKKTNFCSETLKLALNWPLTDPGKRGHMKPLFCTLLRKFHVMTSTYFQNLGNSGWNWTVVVKLKPQQKISGEYVPHGP